MTLSTGQVTVGTVAVQLDGTSASMWQIHIHNHDQTDALYIGNSDVSSTTGLQLPKLDSIELTMNPGETLHVISTKTGHVMSYLKQV
jgi:hypothetical protein